MEAFDSLLYCYVHVKSVENAEGLFKKMKELGYDNSLSYNTLMNLYLQTKQYEKLDGVVQEMNENGISGSRFNTQLCNKRVLKSAPVIEELWNQLRDWFSIEGTSFSCESDPWMSIERAVNEELGEKRWEKMMRLDCIGMEIEGKILDELVIEALGDLTCPHSELIEDPEGPYSRLISLRAGKFKSEEAPKMVQEEVDTSFGTNAAILGISGIKRLSMRRSAGRGSSGGGSIRHSFSLSFGLPTAIPIHEDGREGAEEAETGHRRMEKQSKVPLTRLATLNKPEFPLIIIGSIGAAAQALLSPVLGILPTNALKIFYEPAKQLRKDSRILGLMLLRLAGIDLVAISVAKSTLGIASAKLIQRIRCFTFERVARQEISRFDEPINSRCVNAIYNTIFQIIYSSFYRLGDFGFLTVEQLAQDYRPTHQSFETL
ncbi:ATP-binding cassette, sub- B (MDR TAP), member 11a [Asimina triloba]